MENRVWYTLNRRANVFSTGFETKPLIPRDEIPFETVEMMYRIKHPPKETVSLIFDDY